MFGEYLKQLRLEKGLTQKELATKLNLSNEEFIAVDSVTVSRWERGSTAPHTSKAIKILQTLTLDLTPYLNSIPIAKSHTLLDDILYDSFHSNQTKIITSSYKSIEKSTEILEEDLFQDTEQSHLDAVKIFFKNTESDYPGLMNIRFRDYYEENKIIAKKYVDKNTKELLGHNIWFLFDASDLDEHIQSPFDQVPFEKAKRYTSNSELAFCAVSRFYATEEVYWELQPSQLNYIAERSNIKWFYYYALHEKFAKYLEEIGCEKVTYDTPTEFGAVTIGKQSFKHCLYRIETSNLFARPEVLAIMRGIRD
ncbi:helix-turn-helix domain-containing protein [Vibrio jasicida]|uniref:helix-turn-helix domain-containing protein n=1 Tax=Vibrio jasicida TaxID=766224 RepID=UPI0040684DAA